MDEEPVESGELAEEAPLSAEELFEMHKADIEAGRITDDEVLELLGMLRIRCMEMNQQSGREIRKRSSGNARWINMTIGGVKPDGSDACNELTRLILQAVRDVRTPHHTVTLRVCDTTPDDVMLAVSELAGCQMLLYQHFKIKYRIADEMMPGVTELPLAQAVVTLLTELAELEKHQVASKLLSMATDGVIDTREQKDFDFVMQKLDGVRRAVELLRYSRR